MQSKSLHIPVQLNKRIFHLQHVSICRMQSLSITLQKFFKRSWRSLIQSIELRLQRLVAQFHMLSGNLMFTIRTFPYGSLVQRITGHLFTGQTSRAAYRTAKCSQLRGIRTSGATAIEAFGKTQMSSPFNGALQRLGVSHLDYCTRRDIDCKFINNKNSELGAI